MKPSASGFILEIMPGDEKLSTQKQAEIAVYTKQWDAANAKGDTAGMASAHAAADAVRNRAESTGGSANSGANSAAYQLWKNLTAGLPPTPYTVLVEEIAKIVPALSLSEVLKTAYDWVDRIGALTSGVRQPLQDVLEKHPELEVVYETASGIQMLANQKGTESDYTKSQLTEDLGKVVDSVSNILQVAARLPYNTTKEALEIVLSYDAYITEVAENNGMNKALLQTVLFQEIRFYNVLDEVDSFVIDTYTYKHQLETYLDMPWWKQIIVGAPKAPLVWRFDSSTGLGQIFAATAIDAINWKEDPDAYDPNNWRDVESVWMKLHYDDYFNIEMAGLVLAYGASLKEVDISSITPSDTKMILARYNGTGSGADTYGDYTYKYYVLFHRYNLNN